MAEAGEQADALDALRASLASPEGVASIALLDENALVIEDLGKATSLRFASGLVFLKSQITRLAKSRTSPVLQEGSTATPSTSTDDFFPLDALVFAVQMASAQGGLYVVQATSRGLPRLDALERQDILAYLTGARNEWEGVLSKDVVALRALSAPSAEAGPSTTPPSSPPAAHKAMFGQLGAVGVAGDAAAAAAGVAAKTMVLPPKRPYVPSKADAAFVKRLKTSGTEITPRTRNDALRGSQPWSKTADFASLRATLAPQIDAARKVAGAGGSSSSSSRQPMPSQSLSNDASRARKGRPQDPIIVLSNSPTSLINMFNVKSFLEEGTFVPPEEARLKAGGMAESIVIVNHRLSSQGPEAKARRFLVVDNVEALARLTSSGGGGSGGGDAWTRVCAVFTTGQLWQFKEYRWSEPRELFKNGECAV